MNGGTYSCTKCKKQLHEFVAADAHSCDERRFHAGQQLVVAVVGDVTRFVHVARLFQQQHHRRYVVCVDRVEQRRFTCGRPKKGGN